jgi:UDP-glucose:glycoprotein glucosyltransferase
VLYADITSKEFSEFHRHLSKSAREGKISYRLRYKPTPYSSEPLTVNGYGVELALKRTDYIVIDDREKEGGRSKDSSKHTSTGDLALEDADDIADLRPLSTTELGELGIKAATFILGSDNPLKTFQKLTQDFPKHSSTISAQNISDDFRVEWEANTKFAIPEGYNIMWMNGVQIDPRTVDPFSLLAEIKRERSLINGFRQMGFAGPQAISLLSHRAIAEAQSDDDPQRYDFRDEEEGGDVIMWLNNIEKDKRYDDWPSDLQAVSDRQTLLVLALKWFKASATGIPWSTPGGKARHSQCDRTGGFFRCKRRSNDC